MPEQLTLRLRKPGVILLTGDPPACEAVRAALEALGPGFRCEVWTIPEASEKLKEAVAEHDGETWDVEWDPLSATVDSQPSLSDAAIIETPHGLIMRPTWAEAVYVALQEWLP